MDLESPPAATSGRSSPHHRQPTTAVVFLSSATSSSQSSSISSQSATSGTWSQDRERAAGRNQLFNPAFNWTVETPKPVSTTTFVDCGQNKSTGTTISQPRSEAASPSSSSGTSPPPPKIRRMQVGITQQSTSTTSGRSVGQRIKEASLKDAITTHQHGATTPSSATVTPRTSRTTISTCEQVVQSEPIALNEIQKNTLRVIGQYLRDLGMNDTVEALVEESGCRLENSLAVRLREYVHHGNWNKALDVVEKIRSFIDQTSYITLRVVLLEEKLKELLAYGEKLMALRLLQVDYPKIEMFANRRKYYATLLMEDTHLLMNKFYANKQGNKSNAMVMAIVQKIVPPSFMLPPARLEELLNQAWLYQMSNCKLHVMPQKGRVDETCILKDHECGSAEFPTKNIQVLHDHCAEVWCLEFSPCGRYLASGAKSNCVHIWKVDNSQRVSIYRRLQILQDITGVSSISWSQDSQFLTVSTPEENNTGVFVFDVRKGTLEREFKFYGQDTFSVASFFKDQSHKFAAGDQKGHFSYYDLDRDLPHNDAAHGNFEGYRVRALYCLKDGKSVLAADTHNRIRRYDFESHYDETIIQEMSPIMYFTVDRAEKQCLVTTKTEGIRLWCLKSQTLLQSFFGALHGEFVISACFGGFYDNFIASGSEDDNVVIWNTKRSSPIKYLQGHTGTVNAVSWNPVHLCMLASGSDDGTIRIWSTNSPKEIE